MAALNAFMVALEHRAASLQAVCQLGDDDAISGLIAAMISYYHIDERTDVRVFDIYDLAISQCVLGRCSLNQAVYRRRIAWFPEHVGPGWE